MRYRIEMIGDKKITLTKIEPEPRGAWIVDRNEDVKSLSDFFGWVKRTVSQVEPITRERDRK